MVRKEEVAYGIISGLEKFWNCEELQDFTVSIGTSQFGCHRLLLAACSDFFRGLFRSGMKETAQKCVSIHDISSETFKLIMKIMYTGNDILTNDNVIDIWRAAHQLQIGFLIWECETFVLNNLSLENYVEYLQVSKALDSEYVQENVWSFVHKNANLFFQTSYFLDLPFAEVLDLVKCQDLQTKSEDDVIEAILKWVAFQDNQCPPECLCVKEDGAANNIEQNENTCDEAVKISEHCETTLKRKKRNKKTKKNVAANNSSVAVSSSTETCTERESSECPGYVTSRDTRDKYLTELLSYSRTCLASKMCLKMLMKHHLTKDNKDIKDIIIDSLLYQLQVGTINGQWPSRALQRNNSELLNCLVKARRMKKNTTIDAYSIKHYTWLELPIIYDVTNVKLVSVGTKLLALCNKGSTTDMILYQLINGEWSNANINMPFKSRNFSIAAVESSVFIYRAVENTLMKLDSTSFDITHLTASPVCEAISQTISHMLPYNQWILVFYASSVEGVDETIVQCYDTLLNTWKQLNNIEGPAKGIISFKDDNCTYILQCNGDLWKVVHAESNFIDFRLVVKLWSFDLSLYGAATFMDELYINCDYLDSKPDVQISLPGLFSTIHYLSNSQETLMSIPMTLDKKCLPSCTV